MTIEHASISDSQRHEPKHASTAVANTVLKSNGDGTTRFEAVAYSELTGTPNSIGYQGVLLSANTASIQAPSATNTPLAVAFGSSSTSSDGSVSISGAGVLTFNTSGYYEVNTYLQFGRSTTTAGQALVLARFLYNGSQVWASIGASLSAAIQVQPYFHNLQLKVNAGDTLSWQIVRDAAGVNDGGLIAVTTSASGWQSSPNAQIQVSRLS